MTIFAPYAFELVSMEDTDTSDVGGQDTPWKVTIRPIGISLSEACLRLRRIKELLAYNFRIDAGKIIFHSFETNEIYRALGMALPRRLNERQKTLSEFCDSEARRLYWLSDQQRQRELSHYEVELARAIEARLSETAEFAHTAQEEA
jgi:Lhr-like helicase